MDSTIIAAIIGVLGAIAAALISVLLKAGRERTNAPQEGTSQNVLARDEPTRPPPDDTWIDNVVTNPQLYSALQTIRTVRDTCLESTKLYGKDPHYSPSLDTHKAFKNAIAKLQAYVGSGFPFGSYFPPTFDAGYKLAIQVLEFMKGRVSAEIEGKQDRY